MRDFRSDGGFRATVDNFVGGGDNYDDYSLDSTDEREILDSFVNNAPPRPSKSKKRKLSGDERLNRCRERNRIHARNTRERKKAQMDTLQLRVHVLNDEVSRIPSHPNTCHYSNHNPNPNRIHLFRNYGSRTCLWSPMWPRS